MVRQAGGGAFRGGPWLWAGPDRGFNFGARRGARDSLKASPNSGTDFRFEEFTMGTLPKRKDIPPWVKVPEDLRDPEVFQVQTGLLEAMFGK